MTELPNKLDAVYWEEKAQQEMAYLVKLTGLPAEEIEASMSEPDDHSRKTAAFSPTPYGQILVRATDRGYPREKVIEYSALISCVVTAMERGYTIIDRMNTGA